MDCLSELDVEELKKVFSLISKNNNGEIKTKDLRLALRSLGYNPTEAECQDLINLINGGDPGPNMMLLRFCKILTVMSTEDVKQVDAEHELKEVFDIFDKNKSGRISAMELRRVMNSVGERLSEEEALDMLQILHPNGTTEGIEYKQFIQLIS